MHAGKRLRRAVLLLRGRNFGDRRVLVERRRITRHVVDVFAAARALRCLTDRVFGHAIGSHHIWAVVSGATQGRNYAEVLAGAVMSDTAGGFLLRDRLGEGREVRGRNWKDDFIPRAARGFDRLLVVRERGTAADAVERHADDLATLLDVLPELADRFAGDLEHHAGAV